MAATSSFSKGRAPGALPLLGHALQLARRPLEFLTSLRAHGDLVEIRIGPKRAYVPCDPAVLGLVWREPATFDRGGMVFDKFRHIAGNGLLNCPWDDHQRQRPLMQPAFSRARLTRYGTAIEEEVAAMTASWCPGQTVNVKPVMDALLARVTARTLFSADLGSAAVAQIQESLPVIVSGIFRRMLDPTGLWEKLPTPHNRRYRAATARLHAVTDQVLHDYRTCATDHGDMMSMLLNGRDDQAEDGFTDQEIHNQILTILIAGTETTATTLAWALHLLSQHPDVEARVHAEIEQVLGERPPSVDDVPRLEFTRHVVTETLRLYPPGWILTRTTTVDTELAGHPIRAGGMILISPYLLHRDPAHFANPDRFDPDRWLDSQSVPRGAYVPFGMGARKCIGDVLAMTEAVIALATICARWRLRPTPGLRTRAVPKAALFPEPLTMVAQPRP